MKRTHVTSNQKQQMLRRLGAIVASAAGIGFIAVLLTMHQGSEKALSELRADFFRFIGLFWVWLAVIPPTMALLYFTIKAISSSALRTTAHRIGLWLTQRMDMKNSSYLNPLLLNNLYHVLRANNDVLQLPLGQDASALIPNGYCAIPRAGVVFYRYQLIMPEAPSMDEKTLRSIIRNYLWATLGNYGIEGLAATYTSPAYGPLLSVFLDRVWYDEALHLLNLELLYIRSEEAARYALSAVERDKAKPQVEPEVFDDEI